ncbi:MAG TPA: glycosyltransferase family 9 protein, partial [Steroidobacteraceae bacterium]
MGDIIHALPGAASLKHSFPDARVTWVVEPKWAPLLEGNGFVDRIVVFRRDDPRTWRLTKEELRAEHYDLAVDFQGLFKSALIAHLARPERIAGFGSKVVRERLAGLFYSARVPSNAVHVVDQALDLAAGAGASNLVRVFPLPAGAPEGRLPAGPFALASPLAGWASKQWPLECYEQLARMLRDKLGMPLVLTGAPGTVPAVAGTMAH